MLKNEGKIGFKKRGGEGQKKKYKREGEGN
jgi:hypothetical protein